MSQRSSRRRVSARLAAIVFAVLLPTIAVLAAPVAAAGAAPPVLFSIVAHDSLVKGVTSCPKQGSEVGDFDCAALQVHAIDGRLDATAAQILVADKREEIGPAPALTNATATAHLSAAERTWLAFRNADCTSWSDHNAGGTIVSLDIVECALMDGKTRLAELKRQLKAASA